MKTNYADRMKSHLAIYKVKKLGVEDNGLWNRNQKQYPHILPMARRELNLLESIRKDFWAGFSKSGVKLHRDFHHLNSSQAMCLNLFYPFVQETVGSEALLSTLGLPVQPIEAWQFEYEPEPEERTNFDFYLKLPGGCQVYFELKLTESKFGAARDDANHRRKLEDIYGPHLEGLVEQCALQPAFFFKHYQLLRNVSYLASGPNYVFLIFPYENIELRPAIDEVRSVMTKKAVDRMRVIYLEDFVSGLAAHSLPESLDKHMRLFTEKYLPPCPYRR